MLAYTVSGNTLTASISTGPIFTLTLSGTDNAAFTFTLLGQLDHPAGSGDDANLSLNLSSAILATDNNGDSITVDNGFTIFVENDVPIGVGSLVNEVYEDALPDGNRETASQTTIATGNISGLFSIGADKPGTYGLLADTSGLPSLTSAGEPLSYTVSGNTQKQCSSTAHRQT